MTNAGWTLAGVDGGSERRFYALWGLASLTYVLGDGTLTLLLLEADLGLVETNVAVRTALELFGSTGLFGLKAGVMLTCLSVSVWLGDAATDRLALYGPPSLLVVAGLGATVYNALFVL